MRKHIITVLLIVFCSLPIFSFAEIVNLNKEEVFLHKGFSPQWTEEIPGQDWISVPGEKNGKRIIRVQEVKGMFESERHFLSFKTREPEHFTFAWKFNLDIRDLNDKEPLALYLEQVGDAYEIFLNGHLISNQIFYNKKGEVITHQTLKTIVPINSRYLKEKDNLLYIHFYSDPEAKLTGFYRSSPYVLDKLSNVQNKASEKLSLFFITIYLFVAIYILYLYFLRSRSPQNNLWFGLFAICLSTYLFVRTGFANKIFLNSVINTRIEFITVFLLIPLLGAFLDCSTGKGKVRIITKIIFVVYGFFALFNLFAPRNFLMDLLMIWQISAVVVVLYYLIWVIARSFVQKTKECYVEQFKEKEICTFAKILEANQYALFKTGEGAVVIGGFTLGVLSIVDVINAAVFLLDLKLITFGFFVFVVGLSLVLAKNYIDLNKETVVLTESLTEKVFELEDANKSILRTTQRYESLINNTSDFIFTLSKDGLFVSANNPMKNHYHWRSDKYKEISIYDVLEDYNDLATEKFTLRNQIEECLKNGGSFTFTARIKARIESENQEMMFILENLNAEENEVLGKAIHLLDDSFAKHVLAEKQSLKISNNLSLVDHLTQKLVKNVSPRVSSQDLYFLKLSLKEMLFNAIEHGNLSISYHEKTEALMNDSYFNLIKERQRDSNYRRKHVFIDYQLSAEKVVYRITDEGVGFDHQKVLADRNQQANEQALAHGRGISMSQDCFDEIVYNKKGNQVLLTKYFS